MKPLIELYYKRQREKYPDFPDFARPKPTYSDKDSNSLTKCIVDFLNFSGHQAERISTTGRLIDNTEMVSDILGKQRRIGSTKWIKGSGKRGSADISSIIKVNIAGKTIGLSVKWEVKIGRDTQKKDQKEYQANVERAGGVYHIVKDWDDFYTEYLKIINLEN